MAYEVMLPDLLALLPCELGAQSYGLMKAPCDTLSVLSSML
jgi:hypothetical protein